MSDDISVAEIQQWTQAFDEIRDLISAEFARTEPRNNALGYIQGLLSDEERKNSWTLSERAGQTTPDGMQRLLSTTDWDPEAVRNLLFRYVRKHLGHPEGILAIDETGFLKKGTASAGVARQYSGTAGRVENCQIGVFLSYATPAGRTLIDRELYVPKVWMDDPRRCRRAGIPEDRVMATKPVLAAEMLQRALDAGIQAQWVTGDAVYGKHSGLRRGLEARDMHYVLAVPMNHHVIIPDPASFGIEGRADELFAGLDGRGWRARTAGAGTKGDRLYGWARIRINGPTDTGEHWLLARRSLKDPTDLAYYVCYTPSNVTLRQLARVAGARWAIEENFQRRNRVRSLSSASVHRLVPAHNVGDVCSCVSDGGALKKGGPKPDFQYLVRLSLPEIRRLITRIVWPRCYDPAHILRWSLWRRQHQYRAQQCHYTARGHTLQQARL